MMTKQQEAQIQMSLMRLIRVAQAIAGRPLTAPEALQLAVDALLEIEEALNSCATTPDSSDPSRDGTTEGS